MYNRILLRVRVNNWPAKPWPYVTGEFVYPSPARRTSISSRYNDMLLTHQNSQYESSRARVTPLVYLT